MEIGNKMGCDIHSFVEIKHEGIWRYVPELFEGAEWAKKEYGPDAMRSEPFCWRNYGVFGFLAGVRNYSAIPVLVEPRGLPEDITVAVQREVTRWDCDMHTPSWLALSELLAFDFDQEIEDRRVTREISPRFTCGACTAEPGGGAMTTYREFLGPAFFQDLEVMKELGDPQNTRIVFWFDN